VACGWLAGGTIWRSCKTPGCPTTGETRIVDVPIYHLRIQNPKKMAQQIDLSLFPEFDVRIELFQLIRVLRQKKNIIVIAGAGISASAGSMSLSSLFLLRLLNGLVSTFEMMSNRESDLFRASTHLTDDLKQVWYDMCSSVEHASPTQFHQLIAKIAKEDRLLRLYTQNIDGLEAQLPLMETEIPLPSKPPWPKTIQLHGDLRTTRCVRNPLHLARFDPALFDQGLVQDCDACRTLELENQAEKKDHKRRKRQPIALTPRIYLYEDNTFADIDAIQKVQAADTKKKVGAVIVVGTALKVVGAKKLAIDLCRRVRECGGFTAWINLKSPTQALKNLDLDLVIKGDCEKVANYVLSWWLKECPTVLSDVHIQELQKDYSEYRLVDRSPKAVLKGILPKVDNLSLSEILQQKENKARILGIEKDGQAVFVLAEGSRRSGIRAEEGIGHNIELSSQLRNDPFPVPAPALRQNPDVFPKLPECWETEMSKRLSEVEVQEIETQGVEVQWIEGQEVRVLVPKKVRISSSVVTTIVNLGYKADAQKSLWHLKPGEYLNDEVMNAYLELLPGFMATTGHSIWGTFILDSMKPETPYKTFGKLIKNDTYSIYIPINNGLHWTFAVITKKKDDSPRWTYYDSLGGGPPRKFLSWINKLFYEQKIESLTASPNPGQGNDFDCGLFVLLGIRLLSAGRDHLSQAQSDEVIPRFRQRVLAELLATSLNPSSSQFEEFQRKEAHAETILPQVEKAGNGNQVDSPDSSVLFMSPPAVPDQIEDAEMDSSDALDESEEEIAQVNPPMGKAPHKKKTPEQVAATFGEEASMRNMLREAVAIARASQKGLKNPKIENIQLPDLWLMISTEKRSLKQRHIHYEFSRQFWAEVERLKSGPHQSRQVPKAILSQVMSKLKITNETRWKYILQQARRASVWTELTDIFKNDLEDPSVVLCAVPDSTYTLETMTLADRTEFLQIIRSRIAETGNGILARLQDASALYKAAMYNDVPEVLAIESSDEHLPFKDSVGC
jgi:NAD+-dependent protein deacetylase SIR2